jgi:uncharacterized membrane protein YciS (DUF1049 family)
MKRALFVIFLLVIALSASILTQLNLEQVEFHYYFGDVATSLSVLLLLTFFCGALFGLLLTAGLAISARSEKRQLSRRLQLREQEIRNLREIPIKGRH